MYGLFQILLSEGTRMQKAHLGDLIHLNRAPTVD